MRLDSDYNFFPITDHEYKGQNTLGSLKVGV